MNREKRIAWARRKAAENTPERERRRLLEEQERSERIASLGSSEANRRARVLDNDSSAPWLGPVSTPHEWSIAVTAARAVTIEAARRGHTITYGELRLAAYEATGMRLGFHQYAELAMSVNEKADGCLLSAIIVKSDTHVPGDGFLPYARSQSFHEPLDTVQRQVFEHFAPPSSESG